MITHQRLIQAARFGLRSTLAAIVLGLLSSACGMQDPIKVGFAGELTGKQSDLGARGRDAVQLAVETINASGGIAGRRIELIVKDDLGTPEGAVSADQALIKDGVVGILGHMNSTQTIAGWAATESAGMVLLSPVATSPDLSGHSDHFFRIVPTHIAQARALSQHLYVNRSISKLAVIYDTNNSAFTQSYWDAFAERYREQGGTISREIAFASTSQPDFAALVGQMRESGADSVLIITSALDAALIAQQTRLQDWPVPLFSSAWAQTDILIQNGGQAVEGMEFTIAFDVNSQEAAYLDFKRRYVERFGREPTFADGEAYEAALVLFAGLEKTQGSAKGLPEALQATSDFPGLVSPITLDQYGDAVRPLFLVAIENGAFKTLPTILKTRGELMASARLLTINRILLRLLLIRLFLPLLLITIVALGLGSYLVVRNDTTRQLRLTRSLSHTVNSYLDQASRVLSTVAQVAEQSDPAFLATYMQTTWRGYGYFDALYALDQNGRILQLVPADPQYAGMDMSRQFYFEATRGQTSIQISKPFMSPRTGQPTVYLALPLQGGGVVAGELNLGDLQQTVAAAYDADDRDTVFIADQVGTLLAHPQVALVAQQTNIGNREIAQRGLREETTLLYTTSAGIVLGSATPITQTNWVVIAEIPLQTAAGPLAGAVGLSFLISLIAWALIAWSLKRQLVRHVVTPLARLGRGANALADGDFTRGEELVEHPGALAEIADLGANFHRMSRAIQSRQAALQDSEVRLRLILEHMPVMLDALDDDDKIVFWNRECERVTGYSAEEMLNNPQALAQIYPDAAMRAAMFSEWQESAIVYRQRERELTTKEGQIRTVAWSTITAHHPIPGWKVWSIGVDITERKRLEEQLRQSQKMQAIGQLAGGVAHDFNNLLTVIIGYTDLALATMPPGDDWGETIEEIQKAARRAAALTHQLLAFSRRQILQPKVIDLNHAVSEIKDMLGRLIGENIDLMLDLDERLAPITVDPSQMHQVIMNLVINARDAMPRGGVLAIKTGNVEFKRALPLSESELPPGAYVMLTVSDTGIGMNEETLSHIFEPFFTTKEKSKGTGLGLATTQGIVSQSGGHIEVASAPGLGSIFNLYFPRSAQPESEEAPALAPVVELDGSETILLVEDEPMVRALAHRILNKRGYRILQAGNSDSALRLCAETPTSIDLLVTDVVMPGSMNGRELAERLRLTYPGLKVIYMSGYTDSTLVRQDVSSTEQIFLPKPFTPDSLLHKVREVLGRDALESEPHHAADL